MKFKILLINPPFHKPMIREGRCQSPQDMRKHSVPQMTLAYIARQLIEAQFEVKLFDCIACGISIEELKKIALEYSPLLIVLNTTTPTINSDLTVARELREVCPNAVTVVFGAHASVLHNEIMEVNPELDVIVRGEPELSILEIALKMEDKKEITGVYGCTVRVGNSCRVNPERELAEEIDNLGWPARELLPNEFYVHPLFGKPYAMVNVSRGCPHRCIFCVASIIYGRRLRKRSVEDIIAEVEQDVIGRYGMELVWFYADNFTLDRAFAISLNEALLRKNIKIKWWSNARADEVDNELLRKMRKSGCYMLSIGAESGNQGILNRAKKKIMLEQIQEAARLCRKNAIVSVVYFLIGLPGENMSTIQETIKFAATIKADFVEFYPAVPYPGTEFYDIAANQGLIKEKDWSKYECGGSTFVISLDGVNSEDMEHLIRDVYRSFYMHPSRIFHMLSMANSPSQLFRLFRFGIGYFRRFDRKGMCN